MKSNDNSRRVEDYLINKQTIKIKKDKEQLAKGKFSRGKDSDSLISKQTGQCFIGFSFSQNEHKKYPLSHKNSIVRQAQYDLNEIQDREYKYVWKTNDDGWLCGGGEGSLFKVTNVDSSHIELFHPGTFEFISLIEIISHMKTCLFDPIPLKPTTSRLNPDLPPEFEIQFLKEDNPEMWNVYIKLAQIFKDTPNSEMNDPFNFHISVTRKIQFHSDESELAFLEKTRKKIESWRAHYPKGVVLDPLTDTFKKIRPGGVYLFANRNKPICYFPGNGEAYVCVPEKETLGTESYISLLDNKNNIDHSVVDTYLSKYYKRI